MSVLQEKIEVDDFIVAGFERMVCFYTKIFNEDEPSETYVNVHMIGPKPLVCICPRFGSNQYEYVDRWDFNLIRETILRKTAGLIDISK